MPSHKTILIMRCSHQKPIYRHQALGAGKQRALPIRAFDLNVTHCLSLLVYQALLALHQLQRFKHEWSKTHLPGIESFANLPGHSPKISVTTVTCSIYIVTDLCQSDTRHFKRPVDMVLNLTCAWPACELTTVFLASDSQVLRIQIHSSRPVF